MCDPVTMLVLASSVASAVGSVSEGVASKNQADFEAADQRQRAVREREIATQDEIDFRRQQSRAAAASRAAGGRSGVISSTGSSLLAASDFASETELNALRIKAGGETTASRLEEQARLTKSAGKSAKKRGFFRAGSSLLSGASKAFK